MALAGSLGLQGLGLLPWCLTIAVALALYPTAYVAWGSGLVLVLIWWLQQGHDEPEGWAVTRAEAPTLWATLDELAQALQTRPVQQVVLVNEATAAASDHQDRWRPWRYHQTLVLGVPLLLGLSPQELRAVLAHEMAHFSRHFGLGGHWLYRARQGWTALDESDAREASIWTRTAVAYAHWFAPYFQRLTAVEAVANEFEADQLAATVGSPRDLASALMRLCASRLPESGGAFGVGPVPDHPLQDLGDGLRRAWSVEQLRQALAEDRANHSAADPLTHTHPPAEDRVRALLGADAAPWALEAHAPQQAAGPQWWGPAWPERLSQTEQRWHQAQARGWRLKAAWLEACEARLTHLDDPTRADPDGERLEFLLALDRLVAIPDPLPTAEALSPVARYGWAAMLLQAQHGQALAWAEDAIRQTPVLAAPLRARVLDSRLLPAQAKEPRQRQQTLWRRALDRRADAVQKALQAGPNGVVRCDLAAWRLAALRYAVADDPVLQRVTLLAYEPTLADGRRMAVAMLCVQMDVGSGVFEPEITRLLTGLMSWACGPLWVPCVQTWWSTETWPDWVQAHQGREPSSVLLDRPVALRPEPE